MFFQVIATLRESPIPYLGARLLLFYSHRARGGVNVSILKKKVPRELIASALSNSEAGKRETFNG